MALKEGRALGAPRLLLLRRFRAVHSRQQSPGQSLQIERVGPGDGDQLAELQHPFGLQTLGLVRESLQLSVDIAGFTQVPGSD